MRKLVSILFLIGFLSSNAQISNLDKTLACDSSLVFTIVEEMPVYGQGEKQLFKDLEELYTLSKNISGVVYIEFIINCNGEAVAHTVLKGIDAETDKMVLEKFKTLQKWSAGKQRGKAIDCIYLLPIRIKKGKYK